MICGFCSRECPFSNQKTCECGHTFNKAKSSYWEGGTGTRDKNAMSKNDDKKYSGLGKTTSNKAKQKQEKEKKTGSQSKKTEKMKLRRR